MAKTRNNILAKSAILQGLAINRTSCENHSTEVSKEKTASGRLETRRGSISCHLDQISSIQRFGFVLFVSQRNDERFFLSLAASPPHHNASDMQLIPLELVQSNRDSVRKAREAYTSLKEVKLLNLKV